MYNRILKISHLQSPAAAAADVRKNGWKPPAGKERDFRNCPDFCKKK